MFEVTVLLGASLLQGTLLALVTLIPAAWAMDRGLDEVMSISLGLVVAALTGWIAVFLYWIAPGLGAFSKLVFMSGLVVLAIRFYRDGLFRRAVWPSLAPLAIGVPALVVLMAWAFVGTPPSAVLETAASRWTHGLPIDNMLPLVFADQLRSGTVASPMIGDWLSSDRPPLQTGLYLLWSVPWVEGGARALTYQVLASGLQLWILPASWVLARSLGVARPSAYAIAGLVFFAPVTLVNAVFVWPKLLPAALLCVVAAIALTPRFSSGYATWWKAGAVAGVAAALAMGAHGTTAFVLAGMAGYGLIARRLPSVGFFAAGVVAFLLVQLPWAGYQNFADPPGDRLLKWHVAGVVDVDERSFVEALAGSLNEVTVWDWISGREANVDVIFGPSAEMESLRAQLLNPPPDVSRTAIAREIRIRQFFGLVQSMGAAGLCLLLSPLLLLMNRTRPLVLATWSALALWTIFMFAPSSTVVHQGSVWPQVALLVASGAFLARIRPVLVYLLLAGQALWSIALYGIWS